jgi:3-methyladenine DNA glycosylase AlkC
MWPSVPCAGNAAVVLPNPDFTSPIPDVSDEDDVAILVGLRLDFPNAPPNHPLAMPPRSRATIDPAHLQALNAGTAATTTLVEGLALDFAALLAAAVPELAATGAPRLKEAAAEGAGIVGRMALGGAALATLPAARIQELARHRSDTVRGWAAYALAGGEYPHLEARLAALRPLAADPHFGVREWVWMAARPAVAKDLPAAFAALAPWVRDSDANVRRFASEVTRPRGVWCSYIKALVADPTPGLPLLAPLRTDPSRYVQDSVANWLNDAAKSQPQFVQDVVGRWLEEHPGHRATTYIARRALRSVRP